MTDKDLILLEKSQRQLQKSEQQADRKTLNGHYMRDKGTDRTAGTRKLLHLLRVTGRATVILWRRKEY